MEIVELIAKLVAIGGGLLAAFKLLIEMRENRKQRVLELRWKQSNSARELLKEMLSSKYANDASIMIEWTGREYQISSDSKETITFDEVREALRVTNDTFTDKEVYIRDCFDAFLFHVEMIEQAIKNKLIQFIDIKFPFEYYVKTLRKNNLTTALDTFIDTYTYDNAKEFLAKFT